MAKHWGIFSNTMRIARGDDPSWRFFNRYVGEPVEAAPFLFAHRREAHDAADFNRSHFGVVREALIVVKPKGGRNG